MFANIAVSKTPVYHFCMQFRGLLRGARAAVQARQSHEPFSLELTRARLTPGMHTNVSKASALLAQPP